MLIRIAARKSPLALKQAEIVKKLLENYASDSHIQLIPLTTAGDKRLNVPLQEAGGKGLFVKELEQALLNHEADIAVHSMKDMPAVSPPELETKIFLERGDPRDVLVSLTYSSLSDIPAGSKIGTASVRRQCMIKHLKPDLQLEVLRGNVNTRLEKLDKHSYAGIILAAAGLNRLGISQSLKYRYYHFSPQESLPAIGQGIIGIQCRTDDKKIKNLLLNLDHFPTHLCVLAERALNKALGGNCYSPVGGYARLINNQICLKACVYGDNGKICLKAEKSEKMPAVFDGHSLKKIRALGKYVAKELFSRGADEILSQKIKLGEIL